ncbi:MAG: alpha/beta fold hydrolase [Richelia sp. RM2_1_2]|nr:alpha/beta fold hydrolase [Richelia sp. RM2_1_2]
MYHQQIAPKKSPLLQSTITSKDVTSTQSYGSLSEVVQRAQQDPLNVSEHERQHLESAIGTRSSREILVGKQNSWVPEFQGISSQLWGDAPIQTKAKDDVGVSEVQLENKTRLPDNLKAGIENLSGMAMDDVRVHYNSSKPVQVQALAYTQGTDIHIASGQEKHLPHEAWHVVQQKQGRVKPTIQMKGVGINDDEGLEYEADVMGAVASEINTYQLTHVVQQSASPTHQSIQRAKGKSRIPRAQEAREEVFGAEEARREIPDDLTDYLSKQVKMTPVTVQSTDSNILTGFMYESKTLPYNNTTVLILSGSSGSSEQYTRPMAEKYTRMGARVVALNYRGYGQSHKSNKKLSEGGTPTEKGLYEDAEAIYDHLIQGRGGLTPTAGNEIIVHGYSLGGPIAATLVKRILKNNGSVKGLVLDRAMSSTYEAAKANNANALMASGAKLAVGSFSVKEKLEKIKKINANLPIVITSAGSTDKLAAKDKEIAAWAKLQLGNVSDIEVPNAAHLSHDIMMDKLIPELIKRGLF